MPNIIKNLVLSEISLVADPANEEARVIIVKSKRANPVETVNKIFAYIAKAATLPASELDQDDAAVSFNEAITEIARERETRELASNYTGKFWDIFDALCTSVRSIVGDPSVTDRASALRQSVVQAAAALQDVVAVVNKSAAGGIPAFVTAALDAASTPEWQMKTIEQIQADLAKANESLTALEKSKTELGTKVDELSKALAAANATISEQKEVIAKHTPAEQTEEELLKSFPPAARAIIEKTRAESAANAAALKKMADDRDSEVMKSKVKAAGLPETDAAMFDRIAKGQTKPEDADTILKMLGDAKKLAAGSNLFKSSGSTMAVDGDPDEILKAKANEIRKAKPELSYEAAYAAALEQNPEIYGAYVAKRRETAN